MAKKQEKEIERWVTVNGARVPIFKDGSIGGPKALRDKVQKKIDNDPANKTDHSMIEAENKKAKKESNIKKYKEKGSLRKQQENEIKKKVDNITGKNIKWLDYNIKQQGLGMESADMEDIKRDAKFMNGEKISLYDKAGNEYRGTFNVYNDGGMEVVDIKKEWYNRKPTDTHSTGVGEKKSEQINKDFDTKEKQIAKNKAEKDERNLTYNRPDEEGYTISKDGKYYYRVFGKGDIEVGHIDKNGDAVVEGNVRSVKEARELNNSLAKYERQRKEKLDSKSENYKKLSKEEKAKTEKYIEDNKWVNKQVNDQLKQGKNYNEVMADVHEAMNSEKQITEKLNQQKAKALTKKQKGKQAIREAKEALKKYGVSRGMYKDFDKLDDVYKKLSKMYPYEISQEDYETIYNLFKSHGEYNRFFEIHNYRNRKKK